MPVKAFIDTNIVIYALGPASTKAHLAAPLFTGLPLISTQVLSETANVCSRRFGLAMPEIRKLLDKLETLCRVEIITPATLHAALDIMGRYRFSWYDSLIVATALNCGCDVLYSEDMQSGQLINNQLRILNPFV
ncbi:MAG: PIN domain-containing protein [Sulfuricella sp.]|nr:PIN domain-containing protein [Sulfuricella sp.]